MMRASKLKEFVIIPFEHFTIDIFYTNSYLGAAMK
jgi:hypothetical protein